MDDSRFNRALKMGTPAEQAELKIFYNARLSALKEYKNDPTALKKKDLDAATTGLDGLVSKVLKEEKPQIFKTRYEVFEYLKKLGLKVGKTKLYKDAETGLLRVQKDGTVLLKDVENYIKHPGANVAVSPKDEPAEDLANEKAEAEVRKLRAQAELAENKAGILSGKLIEKDLFYGELAARASIFRSDLINFFRAKAPEMIAIVSGDSKKAPDLIDFCFNELEKALGNYAADKEFNVPESLKTSDEDEDDSDDI